MDHTLETSRKPAPRGISRPGHPAFVGAVIGAVGGTVFVTANAPALPAPWKTLAGIAGGVSLAVWCWTVLLARRALPAPPRPGRSAGWIYLAGLAGMFAIMFVGSRILTGLDRVSVQPAVIVLAVGVHFLPYARAFGAPVFARLGAALAVVGLLGLAAGLAITPVAASAAAVIAGLVLLLGISVDARTGARQNPRL
ncbi:hypothetical protein GCM10009596_19490 [Arthrobacter rhombi]|uniref:hypothetical protein n=1 Tax=Arthrobacter rhombi TaxID=71253 RepID=UPI0031CFA28E